MADEQQQIAYKKRRLRNSCDECRKRKIKCDSSARPGNACSSCISLRTECTHFFASSNKKRGPLRGMPRGQHTLHSVIKAIISSKGTYEPPSDPAAVKSLLSEIAEYAQILYEENSDLRRRLTAQQHSGDSASTPLSLTASENSTVSSESPESHDHDVQCLGEDIRWLNIDRPAQSRHYGHGSNYMFLQSVIEENKDSYIENSDGPVVQEKAISTSSSYIRPEFWAVHQWQILPEDKPPQLVFPDAHLIDSLVSLYFTNVNIYFPVLHAPSFRRSISQNLHQNDYHFGQLLLATCALGARFSDDPRVFEDGVSGEDKGPGHEQSAGWKWIRQIQLVRKTFTKRPSVYEVQLYVIYVLFMQATTTPQACWIIVSIGIRFAQDVGAHRKKQADAKPTLESELWKRAFWMLYLIDIYISAMLGRPRSVAIEDLDVDLPVDCDDEYWENSDDPERGFKQPPGKPSIGLYTACLIKVLDVLGTAMRTIFAIRKSDMWAAMGLTELEWNEKIVAELDSRLNQWIDEIPDHLRWDPQRENPEHFHQSVILYVTFYWVQIQIHRQFIAQPGQGSVLSFPSLAICANASRLCCHVMDVQRKRNLGVLAMPNVTLSLFSASIVLLVNVWRGRRLKGAMASPNIEKEMTDVYTCINLLSLHEKRWQYSGRFCDILRQIIAISHLHHTPKSSSDAESRPLKRSRETAPETIDENRRAELSGQLSTGMQTQRSSMTMPDPHFGITDSSNMFSLPTHSSELGRLPIYESLADWPMNDYGAPVLTLPQLGSQIWLSPNLGPSLEAAPSAVTLIPSQSKLRTGSSPNPALSSDTHMSSSSSVDVLGNGTSQDLYRVSPPTHSSVALEASQDRMHFGLESMHNGFNLNHSANDLDDWNTYMASVDEILQNISSRRV